MSEADTPTPASACVIAADLNVAKGALGPLMTEEDFGLIFAAGTVVYGFAFVLNGPLTDKIGGRLAMLAEIMGQFEQKLDPRGAAADHGAFSS